MSAAAFNMFLRQVATDPALQHRLRVAGAREAAALAVSLGFDVVVADLTRYQARATSWKLSDEELAVVADWQAVDQTFWWQYMWPDESLQ